MTHRESLLVAQEFTHEKMRMTHDRIMDIGRRGALGSEYTEHMILRGQYDAYRTVLTVITALINSSPLRERVAELESHRPDGFDGCTIMFRECDKGHGWLTAANWLPFSCPTCRIAELDDENDTLACTISDLREQIAALQAIIAHETEVCKAAENSLIRAANDNLNGEIGRALKCVAELESENAKLQTKIEGLVRQDGRAQYCSFCFEEIDAPTFQALMDHVRTCDKHPLAQALKENAKLREECVRLLHALEEDDGQAQMDRAMYLARRDELDPYTPPEEEDCSVCGGTGLVTYNPNLNPDSFPDSLSAPCSCVTPTAEEGAK